MVLISMGSCAAAGRGARMQASAWTATNQNVHFFMSFTPPGAFVLLIRRFDGEISCVGWASLAVLLGLGRVCAAMHAPRGRAGKPIPRSKSVLVSHFRAFSHGQSAG